MLECIFSKAPECPKNSHYAQCTNNCANTCASLTSTGSCPNICMEGCECDEGFMLDGDRCVSLGDCGCVDNAKYLKVRFEKKGKTFYYIKCCILMRI